MTPLHDEQAERAVLGMTLLAPAAASQLIAWGIDADCFHHPPHTRAWRAVLALTDQQEALTVEQVARAMSDTGDPNPEDVQTVSRCYEHASPAGALRNDADRLRDMALRRRWQHVSQLAAEAARSGDESLIGDVERLLSTTEKSADTIAPADLGLSVCNWLADTSPVAIPSGFPGLDRAIGGGWRPGDMTVLGAHSSMGKSALLDTFLTYAVRQHAAKAHVYVNEMNHNDRALRMIARETRIPVGRLLARELGDRDHKAALDAASRLPFGVTDCSQWDAERIARHARACRWDVWAVDLVTNMRYRDEGDLADIVTVLAGAARNTGSHCILVTQLNRGRNIGDLPQRPVLRDIKDSSSLEHQSRSVLMLHRQPVMSEGHIETPHEGNVYVDKATHGIKGVSVPVVFRPDRMAFYAADEQPVRAVA